MKRRFLELYYEFFITDFKLRYKHSVLGFFWVIFKPITLFLVLYMVWSSLFNTGGDFALYLLLGVITINFFNEGINFGMQSLFNKGHIILKINFPREIVVYSSVTIAFVNYLINLAIFFGFLLFSAGTVLTVQGIFLFILSTTTLLVLILALSLFLSILSIKLHDIRHLVELVLQLIFWATPVVYNINLLPEKFKNLVLLNPLTHILNFSRLGLLNSQIINSEIWANMLLIMLISISLLFLAFIFFRFRIKKIAQYF